jgi:signal transduction histidine kinase
VPISSDDEIGVLQRSFNTLAETVRAQTDALTEQATVADAIRAQARAAEQLADELRVRNGRIAEQAKALEAEIAERRLAEEALIQARDAAQAASRAKSTFLATMSHELRTPLSAILGYSQLMEMTVKSVGSADLEADLGSIKLAGNHLLRLIEDVLDLSRIEAGKLTTTQHVFGVADLVEEVTDTVKPLVERNNNAFDVRFPPDIGEMTSDDTKVRQILLNLLGNAAKFTSDGRVTLSVSRVAQEGVVLLRFAVADTGIGIQGCQLPRLFQPFTQLDDSDARTYGGSGLGLALSQRLAAILGGRITVESTYGLGSTFTLDLPA